MTHALPPPQPDGWYRLVPDGRGAFDSAGWDRDEHDRAREKSVNDAGADGEGPDGAPAPTPP